MSDDKPVLAPFYADLLAVLCGAATTPDSANQTYRHQSGAGPGVSASYWTAHYLDIRS